nr:YbjQ family protein [Trueperella pecoris]
MMLVTTTDRVEGHPVSQYLGIVNGENIVGINVLRDKGAEFRNFFGGRSGGYENELIAARDSAMEEMTLRAEQLGAQGVVGFRFDYEVLGQGNMLMVVATGTAVRF